MPKMQEQFFGDVHGRTVCRKCRSNFSAMSMEGWYDEAGFLNANSLAFRLMNAIRSANGECCYWLPPTRFGDVLWQNQVTAVTTALAILQPALLLVADKNAATPAP